MGSGIVDTKVASIQVPTNEEGRALSVVAIGVVSPRKLIRKALCSLLLALPLEGGLNVIFDTDTIVEATAEMISSKPQVLLIDCESMANCLNGVHRAREISPSTRCLLLTQNVAAEFEVRAVRSGAWGLITDRSDPVLVQQAIGKVVKGEMWFSHGTMAKAIEAIAQNKPSDNSPADKLTAREAEVTALLAGGLQNKEIAQRLLLSENTVRRYTETIYRKLGVNSRVEVALWYHKQAVDS